MTFLVMVLAVLVLIVVGIPVAYALGGVSLFFLVFVNDLPLMLLSQRIAASVNSYTLIAIPLFILMGAVMNTGDLSDRIYRLSWALVGRMKGGLGQVNVVASFLFAGMSGSGMADAAGLGKIEVQNMKRRGYPADFSAALTAVTASIGPMIPPSIALVLYGVLAQVSIGKLFFGGILPGVMLAAVLMIQVHVMAKRRDFPRAGKVTPRELLRISAGAVLPMGVFVVVMGGVLFGIFTATEASAAAVLYALVIGLLVYRSLNARSIWSAITESARETSRILFIVANAALFGWIITLEQVPAKFVDWLTSWTNSIVLILLLINVFLLIAGAFLDIISVMIIAVPMFVPLAVELGLDPVHFGILLVLNLTLGGVTPPVGMFSFISAQNARVPVARVFRAGYPFLIACLITLLMVTFVPGLSLWLPDLLISTG